MTLDHQHRRQTFAFGTKAETLDRIAPLVTRCQVPKFIFFNVDEWRSGRDAILQRIETEFPNRSVIVRSSAGAEDGADSALAGQFDSVPFVDSGKPSALEAAVDQVIASYAKNDTPIDIDDDVIVQEMIDKVLMSGVLFTRDLNTGAPYYAINYDDETGRTDTVTSGGEYSNRTLYVHKSARGALRSRRFQALIAAVVEIEELIGGEALDIEFAVDSNLSVHLFQIRRISSQANWFADVETEVNQAADQIQQVMRGGLSPKAGIFGRRSVFGQMPDWNPAEIIGRVPRGLALSLYRHLITDRVWREARRDMGYHHPTDEALLVSLGGQPYIDARLSFHSFLPNTLPAPICHKLVDAWLDRLAANPQFHDKVEFDVAITSFAFDFDTRAAGQMPGILTDEELALFRACSKDLTHALVKGELSPISGELDRIERLAEIQNHAASNDNGSSLRQTLDRCIELGTRPFSILARHGFIAQSFLRSLVERDILSAEDANLFMRSIRTVAGEFAVDSHRAGLGEISRNEFFERYGHLRPGTYDILSARYDQRDDLLVDARPSGLPEPTPVFDPTPSQISAIDNLLAAESLDISTRALFDYVRDATAAREYAKFVFTRSLSNALELIASWGNDLDLSRDDLSHLEIETILAGIETEAGTEQKDALTLAAERGRSEHRTTQALRLPQLLYDAEGVHVIPFQLSEPNFITHQVVRGSCVKLGRHDSVQSSLTGAIVLIENADPGFDWIFAHRIGGLVTKFGGTNSHMAIRCAEFGIPAAIGCGEQIFERISSANAVEINCAEGHIRPIDDTMGVS